MNFCLDARTINEHFPGIGRYTSNLAQALVDQLEIGEQLTLIRDNSAPSAWHFPTPEKNRLSIADIPVSSFGLGQQTAVPRQLRELAINNYHSPFYLMPYTLRIPAAVTIHDLIPQHYPQYVSLRARLFFKAAVRMAMWRAQEIITISQSSRRDLLNMYPIDPARITAIPLAPASCFSLQPKHEINRVTQKYQLSDYVLYLGINKPHKNILRLLEAWKKIASPAQLVIAGAWDNRYPEAKLKVHELGLSERVIFLGAVDEDDLPGLYAGAQLFVFPSIYEGFGLPVIEAMACGTVVACANSSSLPEIAADAAVLFNPHSVDDMASAINEILADKQRQSKLRELGLNQASRFSWAQTANETLKVYRRLAAD